MTNEYSTAVTYMDENCSERCATCQKEVGDKEPDCTDPVKCYEDVERDEHGNIARRNSFHQVCIWPGVLLGEDTGTDVEKAFLDGHFDLGVRVQFLESMTTFPSVEKDGTEIEETGGRSDLFIAIHSEDTDRFVPHNLSLGIRWVEDVLMNDAVAGQMLYPERVEKYMGWEGYDSELLHEAREDWSNNS